MSTKSWTVQITLDEEDGSTEARAVLDVQGKTELRGEGRARRNPRDEENPVIGDELAAARALSDLAHRLLDVAAHDIESRTHRPASIKL